MRRFRVVSPKCSAKSSDVKIILSPMTHGPPAICLLSSSKSLTIRSKPRSRRQWTRYGYSNALRIRERSISATGRDNFFSPPKAPRARRNSRLSSRTGKIQARPPRWPQAAARRRLPFRFRDKTGDTRISREIPCGPGCLMGGADNYLFRRSEGRRARPCFLIAPARLPLVARTGRRCETALAAVRNRFF